jgi:phage major head subunit gpT-like protein
MATAENLIAQFNIVARTEYNKKWQEYEPEAKDLLFQYQSGATASVDFPFWEFLDQVEEWKGERKAQTFPDGFKFTVTNKEWDMAVKIRRRDVLRAANQVNNVLKGLDPYRLRISEMPKSLKDHPVDLALNMIANGETNTFGTTFDGQNFFDTTHSFSTSSGNQDNIVTGTGITAANIEADFLNSVSRLDSFEVTQAPNAAFNRKLNRSMKNLNLLVIAPTELRGVFWQLQKDAFTTSGKTNTLQNGFELMTVRFSDANDWYLALRDEPIFRPFLYQVEEFPKLDMPTEQDESVRNRQEYVYGAHGSYNVAYGSWWKMIKIKNS